MLVTSWPMLIRPTTPRIASGWFTSKALCSAKASTSTTDGLSAGVGEEAHLRLDEFALGGDEQDAHVHAVAFGIEDLEVQLDRFHVERHVLLGFPPHQLARLLFLHALDLDLLDDHVAAADGGDDVATS